VADFGVYFQITNNLGAPLSYLKSSLVDATYDGPSLIPSDGQPHRVHLNDPYFARGAEGTVYFTAVVNGQLRQYAWYGSCPVWSSDNSVGGPGVLDYNKGGHPLTVTIAVAPTTPGWSKVTQLIEHVFLLMLENRSLDHMLGFSGITGTDAETGKPTAINGLNGKEKNEYGGKYYPVTQPADFTMPLDPGHEFTDVLEQLSGVGATYPFGGPYPPVDDSGFVSDYAKNGGKDAPGEIMKCYSTNELPVLIALAKEFALCDGWYSSMPGPTWPNRFFSLAASSDGLDHSPTKTEMAEWAITGVSFKNGSIFQALDRKGGNGGWRIYAGDDLPISAFFSGVNYFGIRSYDKHFAADLRSGDYPYAFTLIEPNYGDWLNGTYTGGQSQHPMDDVTHGEALIKSTYEALRNSSLWNSSLLIVTWDEHGGFYDGGKPGHAVPPGDTQPGSRFNTFGFAFDQYGPRVPAVIASPLIPRNLIDHRLYDHASVPATVEAVFGLSPLTARDGGARNVTALATLSAPRTDCPTTLPDPAVSGGPDMLTLSAQAVGVSPDDMRPADVGNVPGFLGTALRTDLEIDPEHQEETLARYQAIQTRADAQAFVNSVWQKIQAKDAVKTGN
jgi:phospholipase C